VHSVPDWSHGPDDSLIQAGDDPSVELEYTDRNSRRSKIYIAVGIIIALIVGGVVYVALSFSGITAQDQVELRSVVVAARDIPSRKPIEEGDVVMRTVAADATNATAFTRIDEVIGLVSGVPIGEGQLVSQNLLASGTSGQAYSILEPGEEFDPQGPHLRAVSINVPAERAVAGTLQPGQWVDVIVTMAINPEVGQTPEEAQETLRQVIPGPSTKVTLQSVIILSRDGDLYIVRADLDTSEKIAELQAAGAQFTFALRPDLDDRVAVTEGSTIDRLLEEFGFPVPRPARLDLGPVIGTPIATPAPEPEPEPAEEE
jgi:Flp pilus assembly protein CpaB